MSLLNIADLLSQYMTWTVMGISYSILEENCSWECLFALFSFLFLLRCLFTVLFYVNISFGVHDRWVSEWIDGPVIIVDTSRDNFPEQ